MLTPAVIIQMSELALRETIHCIEFLGIIAAIASGFHDSFPYFQKRFLGKRRYNLHKRIRRNWSCKVSASKKPD
jgi:hypothetical protein